MTTPAVGTAEVWGSTWVPGTCPVEGLGDDAGYSVAWVRDAADTMRQVVVNGTMAPDPGVVGVVTATVVGAETIDVFTPEEGAEE